MRKVVSPTRGRALLRLSATIASALRFDVFPWSVPIPAVVYRFTCSIERKPSRLSKLQVRDSHVVLEINKDSAGLDPLRLRRERSAVRDSVSVNLENAAWG